MADKILIIDDSIENRLLLLHTLGRAGYEIFEAVNGQEGLNLALEHYPDLILLDVVMPEMDGHQVCEALKKDPRTTDIPIIFLSAMTETQDIIKGLEIGGADYIAKPFDRGEILARVQTQLKIRRLTKELVQTNRELQHKNLALEEANAAIIHMMRTDFLTGLANRRYFLEMLENFMSLARRHHTPLCIIMADLDHFKAINDTYGHAKGDQILRDFGALLKKYSRKEDLAARFGGEEFIMALPLTNLRGAIHCAERIRIELEGMKWNEIKRQVTGSFGISQFQSPDTPESFIDRADKALYHAKQEGRNRLAVAAPTGTPSIV